jgi:AcrR family transcriptional regulator
MESTASRVLDAATNQFFTLGYHGASMKELAEEAGVRSATVYYHFPNKEAMLVEIMRVTLEELTAVVQAQVEGELDPVAALTAAVTHHIAFHVNRYREVFLCDAELRVLSAEHRAEIVALRDRYEAIFRSTLRDGQVTGAMTVEQVSDAYVDLFLRALQARPRGASLSG